MPLIDLAAANDIPTGINNTGMLTGAGRPEDIRVAWVWQAGTKRYIRHSVGENPGSAEAVNDAGLVVGRTQFFYGETPEGPDFRSRAFSFDGTSLHDLGVLNDGLSSTALDVNEHGEIVGYSSSITEGFAFKYSGGTMIELGRGSASAINDAGHVVGTGDSQRAVLWNETGVHELGTLGGARSSAEDINTCGTIVGSAERADGTLVAFKYQSGVMQELLAPEAPSKALAVNDYGEIVGTYGPYDTYGFLHTAGSTYPLVDVIPDDGCWTTLKPVDINDRGEIVGIGQRGSYSVCGEPGRYIVVITKEPARWEPYRTY